MILSLADVLTEIRHAEGLDTTDLAMCEERGPDPRGGFEMSIPEGYEAQLEDIIDRARSNAKKPFTLAQFCEGHDAKTAAKLLACISLGIDRGQLFIDDLDRVRAVGLANPEDLPEEPCVFRLDVDVLES